MSRSFVNIDPPLAGTPFELHYQSERVPGRSGTSAFLTKFARDLGGWTLNVHHAYHPVSGSLYLGTGGRCRAAVLGSLPVLNGNYLVTNQSGSKVHVFDKTDRHLRTLHPLTGATVYAFAYDPNGHLSTITDSSGNVTTIQRDSAGLPSAILAPYGQHTAITVNSDGYITSIVNPNQEPVKLTFLRLGAAFLGQGGKSLATSHRRLDRDKSGARPADSSAAAGAKTLADTGFLAERYRRRRKLESRKGAIRGVLAAARFPFRSSNQSMPFLSIRLYDRLHQLN